jgi:hypothetical protein
MTTIAMVVAWEAWAAWACQAWALESQVTITYRYRTYTKVYMEIFILPSVCSKFYQVP